MDTHSPPSGDLNDLERRLAEWRPSATGLDADRMLFAAGRDSTRSGWGRVAWPIVSGCMTIVAIALAIGLEQERSARLDLVAQFRKQGPPSVPAPSPMREPSDLASSEPPAASSYLAARLALAHNPEAWFAVEAEPSEGQSQESLRIWKANSPTDLLEP